MDLWRGQSALDLMPCRYGYSQIEFRGPPADLEQPYIAFLGGTETVAPLVSRPFADLVAEGLGLECANLGIKNAGLDVFLSDPELLRIANRAERVVVELLGAANLSNGYYQVHHRRNDRFTRAHGPLLDALRGLDLTDVHFTGHLHRVVARASRRLHQRVVAECQAQWLERMRALIAAIERPVHLMRLVPTASGHRAAAYVEPHMVASVAAGAATVTRVEPSEAALREGTEGLVFSAPDDRVARQMLPSAVHREIAQHLVADLSAARNAKARAG